MQNEIEVRVTDRRQRLLSADDVPTVGGLGICREIRIGGQSVARKIRHLDVKAHRVLKRSDDATAADNSVDGSTDVRIAVATRLAITAALDEGGGISDRCTRR